jgi:hypothetical protein
MSDSYLQNLQDIIKNPYIEKYLKEWFCPGTPVNGVASQGTLTLSGVVVDGETVSIDDDTYEFAADEEQTVTSGNTAVDITSFAAKAQGTLTLPTQPTVGDTMTIGSKVYTFTTDETAAADGEIDVGADLADAKTLIVAAINGTDGINTAHTQVSAADFAGNDCVITALIGGTAGNAIATTETFTAVGNVFDATSLGTTTAGDDCTAAEADGALIGADVGTTYSMAQGTGTTVTVTAATKGVAGDLIATTETMANGAFGQATLGDTTAGVDGTVGIAGSMKYDTSYLYLCSADNTISDDNWRRTSIGSAY